MFYYEVNQRVKYINSYELSDFYWCNQAFYYGNTKNSLYIGREATILKVEKEERKNIIPTLPYLIQFDDGFKCWVEYFDLEPIK